MKDQRQGARRALLDAFAELALSRRYQEIGVGLIAGRAAVARSTFYYHFRTKDELLLQNLKPMLSALARLATAATASRPRPWSRRRPNRPTRRTCPTRA